MRCGVHAVVDNSRSNAQARRGGCLDFGHGHAGLEATALEEAGHLPEADFIAKLKAIPGVSQVETQTITNMVL